MRGWRDVLRARRSRLRRLLADYPRYVVPHPGPGSALTRAEAEANLAYLLEHRENRLRAITALLGHWDLDAAAALDADDLAPFLDGVWRWMEMEWPPVRTPELKDTARWEWSRHEGDEIVYSMLMDMAVLEGELIIRRRPDYGWDLDLTDIGNRMGYWQRVALIRPADNIVPVLSWNLPDGSFVGFCNCHDPTWCIPNGLKRSILSIINGGHEAMFHEWIEKREERLAREGRSC